MEGKHINWIRLLTTIIFVLVTAALFLGIGYWLGVQSAEEGLSSQTATATATVTASTTATADVTANWKTYTNDTYGFSFKYPRDWIAKEDTDGVSVSSPETQEMVSNAKGDLPYSSNFSVRYYASVADEPENKGNKLGATTLDELIQKNTMITKIGPITFGDNLSGTDVIWGGISSWYVILTTHNNHLYELWFGSVDAKKNFAATDQQILSTFQFTK